MISLNGSGAFQVEYKLQTYVMLQNLFKFEHYLEAIRSFEIRKKYYSALHKLTQSTTY